MPNVRTAADYQHDTVELARSALVELFKILGSYREALVLVGGWAPYFLLERHQRPANPFKHRGSIDTDLVVNPDLITGDEYATIVELIRKRGYRPKENANGNVVPASYVKTFKRGEGTEDIQVDFMTPRDLKARKKKRGTQVQPDLRARMTEGCEIALAHNFKHKVTAKLPDDGDATVEILVADLAAILATKGRALGDRYKEKDAYDIWAAIAHYEDGPESAAAALRPLAADPVLKNGSDRIAEAFATRVANGPDWVATFLGLPPGREREAMLTDAYTTVNEFLRLLGR